MLLNQLVISMRKYKNIKGGNINMKVCVHIPLRSRWLINHSAFLFISIRKNIKEVHIPLRSRWLINNSAFFFICTLLACSHTSEMLLNQLVISMRKYSMRKYKNIKGGNINMKVCVHIPLRSRWLINHSAVLFISIRKNIKEVHIPLRSRWLINHSAFFSYVLSWLVLSHIPLRCY